MGSLGSGHFPQSAIVDDVWEKIYYYTMHDNLLTFLKFLKTSQQVSNYDEAKTKQAVILPLLNYLGWQVYDIDQVCPEFQVDNGRVDYCLKINNKNYIFIEVKKTGLDIEKYGKFQEQLLQYAFRHGVKFAILTNGLTWWFYLPLLPGNWKERKFYTVDILQQSEEEVSEMFNRLLLKENVQEGKSQKEAEDIHSTQRHRAELESSLPQAWNKIINEPDSLLLALLSETTERICGFTPNEQDIISFMKRNENQLLLSPQDESSEDKTESYQQKIEEGLNERIDVTNHDLISQEDIIPHIVKTLQGNNGRLHKTKVEEGYICGVKSSLLTN